MQAKRKRGRTPTPGRYHGLRDNRRGTFWNNSCICLGDACYFALKFFVNWACTLHTVYTEENLANQFFNYHTWPTKCSWPFCMICQLLPRLKHLQFWWTIWRPMLESRACTIAYLDISDYIGFLSLGLAIKWISEAVGYLGYFIMVQPHPNQLVFGGDELFKNNPDSQHWVIYFILIKS